jgi:hypothetical protein
VLCFFRAVGAIHQGLGPASGLNRDQISTPQRHLCARTGRSRVPKDRFYFLPTRTGSKLSARRPLLSVDRLADDLDATLLASADSMALPWSRALALTQNANDLIVPLRETLGRIE